LAELKAHQIEGTKVEVSDVYLYGPAAEQILHFAKNNDIDMKVMASRRFTGISEIKALRSVARKVSELAGCPVLIIH
jgi:nucleotide-binding universal stress UspA family protein